MIDRDEILREIKPYVLGWLNGIARVPAADGSVFAPTPHQVAGAHHYETGLTVGSYLRATSAAGFAWSRIQNGDLPDPLQSSNYVADTAGWRMGSDGNVFFGNATMRGILRGGVQQNGEVAAYGATLVVMAGHALAAQVTSI